MCGINVIYNSKGGMPDKQQTIAAMNDEMIYRGPDEQSIWCDQHTMFGHCRLSIIGVENGAQPMFNPERTIALVCNGEIYNYLELKEDLTKKGYQFHTASDCEVIIYLYEEYGLEFFSYLRGMFALCLWDAGKKQLVAARDRLGKKPLYYARSADGLVFSSEVKAISKHFLTSYHFNYPGIRHTLKYSHPIDTADTLIHEIKKVKPGEYMVVKDDSLSHHTYWNADTIKTVPSNFETAKKETLRLLTESVDIRLRSDVPVAILLSSGMDSTTVAALAKQCRNEVHAITVGYKGNHSSDEREMAQKFAKDYGLTWHQVELDEKDYQQYFCEYTSVIDEPVCDIAAIAQWGIYKKAKALGFKVLLSGIGGDELFYGYGTDNEYAEQWEIALQLAARFPVYGRKQLVALIRFIIQHKNAFNPFYENPPEKHLSKLFLKDYQNFSYAWPDVLTGPGPEQLGELFSKKNTGIEKLYKFFYDIWLVNNCFHQTDKLGMGNSVEVRAPFADHVLSEYLYSLPLSVKYNKKESPLAELNH